MREGSEERLDEARIRDFIAGDYRRIVTLVTLVCGSSAVAEDAAQEALARAWELEARGGTVDSLPAWVVTVAMNLARSRFRRIRAERRAIDRLNIPEEPSGDQSENRVELVRAVRKLPRRQREVVVLRYYADLDLAEIASALRISVGTTKSTLHKARKALAALLDVHEEAEVADH